MRAWAVREPCPIRSGPLVLVERPTPVPGPGELLVRVRACGVCRTDLHLAEGDLPRRRLAATPGHEVVGEVVGRGPAGPAPTSVPVPAPGPAPGPGAGPMARGAAERIPLGAQVGIAWLRSTCGVCRHCGRGAENLCPSSVYTGWDADGGYAEFATVPEAYAYRLPDDADPVRLAPLLCAGIIGYRALRRSGIRPGGRLGIWGFGASAHLSAQIAIAQGAEVHVFTRSAEAQELARRLGVASAQDTHDASPVPLDAAVLFAPVGALVPVALAALDRGGVLAVAGIHLSDVPPLNYQDHLFYEREVRSVTANTRADGAEFLALAARVRLELSIVRYPLEQADRALEDLAADKITGVAVLETGA
ncbi:MAG: zinc-binding alcohol dehydrogenase family protein [Micromonosporaceae bacterium]|nr:zinc-binding alcohol dehydrogenase family protein [Micromonosporaceae bacterium]